MRLSELEPQWLKWTDDTHHQIVAAKELADGILFLCPKCIQDKAEVARRGIHSIICWNPHIPQTTNPKPGRWNLVGSSFEDLTLTAGSSSVLLNGGCNAHFFITNGEIRMC